MGTIILIILWLILAAALAGTGAYLAYLGKEGWGWFLFVAFLMLGAVRLRAKEKEKEKDEKPD